MTYAPIALFVYNRPEHTKQTIASLQQNLLASQSDLFIFSDAPKKPDAAEAVDEVRRYIKSIDGFNMITIVERDINWGLANSIIDGVTRLCKDFGRVIVLEDDLVVARDFLQYMNDALMLYSDEPRVMQISGYMFPVEIRIDEDALFLPFTTSWGWATWHRAWEKFDPEANGYLQLKSDRRKRKAFDLDNSYPYFKMLEMQRMALIDSWAIRWNLSVFMQHALVLFPKESLVNNNGFDGSGIHCRENAGFAVEELVFRVEKFPARVEVSPDNQARIYRFLRQDKNFKSQFNFLATVKKIFSMLRV